MLIRVSIRLVLFICQELDLVLYTPSHCTPHCHPVRLTPGWPNKDEDQGERKKTKGRLFAGNSKSSRECLSVRLALGPNAISVSLSPMGRYVMVGLASRRILLHPSTEHMVAQVFRLQQAHGGETSMRVSALHGGSPRPWPAAPCRPEVQSPSQGQRRHAHKEPGRTPVQSSPDQPASLLDALGYSKAVFLIP